MVHVWLCSFDIYVNGEGGPVVARVIGGLGGLSQFDGGKQKPTLVTQT